MAKPHPTVSSLINLLKGKSGRFYNPVAPDTPIVSIISSFYNVGHYFEENYQSIVNQTFQSFEWIIVDDCSTHPESIALFESLSQRTPKIKTLSHDCNQGVSAGRNTAIAKASGKYLFFTDLDDILDRTYIEKCVVFLETHPEFSFVNSYSIGFESEEYFWDRGFDKPSQFINQNWVTGRLLYRKTDFDLIGGFDEQLRFYEDWERWLKAIANHQQGWTIPEYLDCYRRTTSGLLATSRQNKTEEYRIKELIQSRYQTFFAENNLADISIDRLSPFEIDLHDFKLDIKNPLDRQSPGKSILCFFPWLEIGGADKFNLDLVTLLANRGYDLTIATTLTSEHPWHRHFYTATHDIFHLTNFLDESHWLAFIRYILESRQIDIVLISNCYIAYYFIPILRAEFPNIAFVDYTHVLDLGWRGSGYPRLSCKFDRLLDCQIVSSQNLARSYQSLSDRSTDKLKVCYTNVDTDKWVLDSAKRHELRSSLGIATDRIVLLFPARIVEQKRPLLLVDIISQLAAKSLPISVLILGDGHLLPAMKTKMSQLGVDSLVQILPPVSPDQMLAFYSASDILLLPSEYEGLSISIYEAMSMQLPIVAADVGGHAELLTPGTGCLIPKGQGDTSEIAAYLAALVPLIEDARFRNQMGLLARQRVVASFSLANMGDHMEAIFAEAIQLSQTRQSVAFDLQIATEVLTLALEYVHKEQSLANLWNEKCQLEEERNTLLREKHELSWQKEAMETSKFWKMRNLWFKVKQKFSLTESKA